MRRNDHTLYRSRSGVLFGVLKGVGDKYGVNVFWLRFIAVCILITTGIFPMLWFYVAAALLMKPEPPRGISSEGEEFYNSYTTNRKLALSRLAGKLDSLDRRTRRMENIVTARGYDWDRRMSES